MSKLKEILSEILEIDMNSDFVDLNKDNCKKWDSLAQVMIITAIESEFLIDIDVDDYEELNSFKALEGILNKNNII